MFGIHVVGVAIVLLSLLVTVLTWAAVRRRAPALSTRFVVGAAAWWALSGALAGSGVLARFDARPPPVLLFFVGALVLAVLLGRSKTAAQLVDGEGIGVVIGVQAFRLPLELAMHSAAIDGVMPAELSFSGWNFDIVTGVLAVVVALLWWRGVRSRALVWSFNVVGSAALLMIVAIALLTSPMVAFFGRERVLNTWVAEVPYVWLPAILVAFAVASHVALTLKLLRR
ncbi:MAG TPA: hypothetical protein VGF99_16565 [Myxococcota bacterium]